MGVTPLHLITTYKEVKHKSLIYDILESLNLKSRGGGGGGGEGVGGRKLPPPLSAGYGPGGSYCENMFCKVATLSLLQVT